MNCPQCGRFMRRDGQGEGTWRCATRHPTQAQKRQAAELVAEARVANREREAREMQTILAAARRHGRTVR